MKLHEINMSFMDNHAKRSLIKHPIITTSPASYGISVKEDDYVDH